MYTEHTGVDSGALDAYSRVVTGVAGTLLPSVAALSVRTARGAGAGSAVTFTDDGFLLTNAHVVAGATGGTVAFADGTETRFDVVGADALSDLAVVRVHNPGAPAAPLGDADKLQIGQLVVAVGNPMGLAGSVTQPPGQDPVNCGPAGTGRAGPAQPAVGSIALGLDRLPAIDPARIRGNQPAGWGWPFMSRQAIGRPRPISAGATVSTRQPGTTRP